jgi:DNA-binding NarL/FixJ family response regulator
VPFEGSAFAGMRGKGRDQKAVDAPTALVAGDHPAMREGVSAALRAGGLTVCAEAADAEAAIELALRKRPDVCMLDIDMAGGGIRAAAEIARGLPGCAIVMLTVSTEDADLFAALRAGATGYVLKDTDPSELPEAARSVIAGEAVIPRFLVARMVEEFRSRPRRRLTLPETGEVELTKREWEVLELLRAGNSTAEIAYALSVKDVTVRRHVSHLMKKLGVQDRGEMLRLVRDHAQD